MGLGIHKAEPDRTVTIALGAEYYFFLIGFSFPIICSQMKIEIKLLTKKSQFSLCWVFSNAIIYLGVLFL